MRVHVSHARLAAVAIVAALATAACASTSAPAPSAPAPGSSGAGGRQEVKAPIDAVDVRVLKSNPAQYVLHVRAGLPSGCAQRNRHEVARTADAITVTVLNWMPPGDPVCTMIYGTYDLTIDLGSDFRSGTTYTVTVNDKKTTFVAG
jgi:hypothetical protein